MNRPTQFANMLTTNDVEDYLESNWQVRNAIFEVFPANYSFVFCAVENDSKSIYKIPLIHNNMAENF